MTKFEHLKPLSERLNLVLGRPEGLVLKLQTEVKLPGRRGVDREKVLEECRKVTGERKS